MIRRLFFLGLVVGLAWRGRALLASLGGEKLANNILPDSAGNYDLDGTSYDRKEHEVVMSGDKSRDIAS